MNAANEIAVDAFLHERLSFLGIWETVGETMANHSTVEHPDLDTIIAADVWAREKAKDLVS